MATKACNSWWSQPTTWEEVCKRVRGRTRINAWRKHVAALRRRQVLDLLLRYGWKYGTQSLIAAQLGVHKSTISRDIRHLFPLLTECPTCGQLRPRRWWAGPPAGDPEGA
jgi:hypothetical protein